jgi:hypothetical protein
MANKRSRTQWTIDNAVIRNDTGYLQVRQCNSKLHTESVKTRHVQEFNKKTIGDITNRLQFNNLLRSIVLNK